jgi:hypothetical protein
MHLAADPIESLTATMVNDRLRVTWDTDRSPVAIVRDHTTGHVIAIGRSGVLEISSANLKSRNLSLSLSGDTGPRTIPLR